MKDITKKNKQDYIVQTVSHALDILEAFSGSEDEYGVTELSNKLGLPKNNVFRLLTTLKERGYIEQSPLNDNYRLGLRLFEMGQIVQSRLGLVQQADFVMKELVLKCNESVYLAVIQESEVVYIHMQETTLSVRIVPKLGKRAPAYCTAVGKVILANESEAERARFLDKVTFDHEAQGIVYDRDSLAEQLQLVQEQGYALDNEEYEDEVCCIAAPIFDYTKRVIAALGITGPRLRMSRERVCNELIPLVKEAALEVSQRLGFSR